MAYDRRILKNIALVNRFKARFGCSCCGEKDSRVLDLHHHDPSTKDKEVSVLVGQGYSNDRVRAEIRKCEIMCVRCHRIEHAPESPHMSWRAELS
jgi:hypothetical protein